METREVYWKDKFGGRKVTINAADFDPAIHADQPWKAKEPKEPKGNGKDEK